LLTNRSNSLQRDPGIVQVFDYGCHTAGSVFIVMELLEGEPIDKRLARIGRSQRSTASGSCG
jgi:serine/threonine protein kinase